MSAEPSVSVSYSEPVPVERSANKAMVETIKNLDAMLEEQRAANAELTAQNKKLWCDMTVAEHALAEERAKPFWRRALKR